MIHENEKFYAKIWKHGDSLIVTIPANIVKGAGYNEGDSVSVLMRRTI